MCSQPHDKNSASWISQASCCSKVISLGFSFWCNQGWTQSFCVYFSQTIIALFCCLLSAMNALCPRKPVFTRACNTAVQGPARGPSTRWQSWGGTRVRGLSAPLLTPSRCWEPQTRAAGFLVSHPAEVTPCCCPLAIWTLIKNFLNRIGLDSF